MKKGVNGCLRQISFNLCNFTLHKVFWHETMEKIEKYPVDFE
jgi:hypothetical protein